MNIGTSRDYIHYFQLPFPKYSSMLNEKRDVEEVVFN